MIAIMSEIRSFPPIATAAATILILGSMPGEESLRAGQYYAHPRNAFWAIMGDMIGACANLPYQLRTRKLNSVGIALWDVLASCQRHGSMDANIDVESIRPNDFTTFFTFHPKITHVFFNGSMAEQIFRKHVLPELKVHLGHRKMRCQRLPSTSPAHAAMPYADKLAAWKAILRTSRSGEWDASPAPAASQHAVSEH